jgi:hypothetical protein
MATCPLHVRFADEPDLDSTITITHVESDCCGVVETGWDFDSPLFDYLIMPPDASRAEAGDAAEAGEASDVSLEQEVTDDAVRDALLDKEATDRADADASAE